MEKVLEEKLQQLYLDMIKKGDLAEQKFKSPDNSVGMHYDTGKFIAYRDSAFMLKKLLSEFDVDTND